MTTHIGPELAAWQDDVRAVVRDRLQPHDAAIERTGRIPADAISALREHGLFGINTPTEYGGLGHSMLGSALAIEELAKAHAAIYYYSGVNVHIGSRPIELFGTEEQKRRWLPGMARGELIASFALTEPEAGSDAAALRTAATSTGDGYLLAGRKTYITNAAEADVFTVFARVDGRDGARGIGAFVVERGTPGLRVGEPIEMAAGNGSSHCVVELDDCVVPAANLLGAENEGFRIAMRALDAGRVHWGAYCVGVATQLLEIACAHATRRETFGRPLREHQGIQWTIADLSAALYAARLAAYEAAVVYDTGTDEERTASAAMSKLIGGDMVCQVADATMQLLGGAGYSKDQPVERIWRESRVVRILDGTSEIMRQIVARNTLRDLAP